MKTQFKRRILGRTGLVVGRLGVAASYGAPAAAFEEAFDHGCNYFYYGSGRHRAGMRRALRNLCRSGQRDRLVVAVQTYARYGLATDLAIARTIRRLGIGHVDILILGWHNRTPSPRLLDRASALRDRGLVRHIGMSGHHRPLFAELAAGRFFDVFHVRYNAAHRGAETEVFPFFTDPDRPGIVTYTATRWGHLLNGKWVPEGERPLSAAECYRFCMSSPAVDICLCGPKTIDQMRAALVALDRGPLDADDMSRLRRIGDHVREHAGGFFAF